MVAGAFVGAAYESLGWMVTSLITGAVAVVGFGVVTASEPPPPREPGQARPQSSGVRDAVKNPLFITFGVTCLTNGYLMMLMMNLLVFNLRDVFDFSAGQVGTVFIATTMIMIACSFYVVPRVSKRFGMRNTINGAGVAIIGLCVLLSLPFAYSHGPSRGVSSAHPPRLRDPKLEIHGAPRTLHSRESLPPHPQSLCISC